MLPEAILLAVVGIPAAVYHSWWSRHQQQIGLLKFNLLLVFRHVCCWCP